MEQKPISTPVKWISCLVVKGVNDGFLATLPDGMLPKRVMLRNRAKKGVWVDVRVEKDGVYFDGGWETFVKENELGVGYFLAFRYGNGNVFDVGIFDHSCCEKYMHKNNEVAVVMEIKVEDCSSNVGKRSKDEISETSEDGDEVDEETSDDSDDETFDYTSDDTYICGSYEKKFIQM